MITDSDAIQEITETQASEHFIAWYHAMKTYGARAVPGFIGMERRFCMHCLCWTQHGVYQDETFKHWTCIHCARQITRRV